MDLTTCTTFQFDENFEKSYLSNYLGIECFDKYHYRWIVLVIIPCLIFYGVIVPISTMIFAYLNKEKINTPTNIFKYDFMMRQPFRSKEASFWLS